MNIFLWGGSCRLYFLARLVHTRLGATAAALLVWVPGLALILLLTPPYPGYATGFLAYFAALWCLGRVAETDEPTVRFWQVSSPAWPSGCTRCSSASSHRPSSS